MLCTPKIEATECKRRTLSKMYTTINILKKDTKLIVINQIVPLSDNQLLTIICKEVILYSWGHRVPSLQGRDLMVQGTHIEFLVGIKLKI